MRRIIDHSCGTPLLSSAPESCGRGSQRADPDFRRDVSSAEFPREGPNDSRMQIVSEKDKVLSRDHEGFHLKLRDNSVTQTHGPRVTSPGSSDSSGAVQQRHTAADVKFKTTDSGCSSNQSKPARDIAAKKPSDTSSVTTPASSTRNGAVASSSGAGPTKSSANPEKQKQKQPPAKTTKSKKKVKELLTPLEYARRVIAETEEKRARGIRPRSTYLRGKKIFYCSNDRTYASDTTKGRMDFVRLPFLGP